MKVCYCLPVLVASETAYGELAGIIDDRPRSMRFRVNSIRAKFIAGLVRA